ncbi:hypothetical protein J4438_01000 [Candidatus Woesearchaeota archaeon]|nr:hypothetical protein [Candidatus Woesearchaeota archaeon]
MKQLVFVQDEEIEKQLKIETELISIIDVPLVKLRNEIQKNKGLVIINGGDENINRAAVENKSVDILLNPERNNQKDSLFFRRSGLNHVLCELARKNDVAIGFNFSNILNSEGRERAKILGRMRQNYKLCKKYRVKMVFSSFAKKKYELRSSDCLKTFERVLNS